MDRREAMLRELNLYPQWVRRNQPAQVIAEHTPEEFRVGPTRTEIDNIHADSSVVTSASRVDGLSWIELKHQVRECTACKLRATCTQTVFGVGVQGEPFVGQAGKLLDSMLAAIKLKRGANVYIANIVKCRPPNNRTPAADEIAQCLPYLQRQIDLIQPRLIVALGKVASNALLGKDATLASLRGTLHDYHGIPLIVTYHPAYLLRSPTEKARAWQDLCFAVKVMADKAEDKNL
jgi:uracil-DNA glycosylase family 4